MQTSFTTGKMRPNKVTIEGFLSVGPPIEVDFRDRGLVFVVGDNRDERKHFRRNGAGKTAIFREALMWALFEKIPGFKHSVTDIPNSNYDGPTRVEIDFHLRKKHIVIARHRGHPEFKNAVTLKVEGEDRTGSTNSITDGEILKLLGVTSEVVSYTTVLGQGMSHRFSSLTPQARGELIENLIRFSEFEKARAEARSRVTQRQRKIDSLGSSLSEAERQLHNAESELEKFRTSMKGRDKEAKARLEGFKKSKVRSESSLISISEKIQRLKDPIQKIKARVSTLTNRIDELKRKQRKYESSSDTCQECGQKLPDYAPPPDHSAEIEKLEAELDSVKSEAKPKVEHYRQLESDKSQIETQIAKAESGIREATRHLKEMQEVSSKTESSFGVEELSQRVEEIQKEIQAHQEKLPYHEYWVTGFQRARTRVFQSKLRILQDRVDRYLKYLTGDAMSVSFSASKTTKSGNVRPEIDVQIELNGNRRVSDGEKDRADVAIMLGLHDLAIMASQFRPSFMIIDEPIVHVDEPGIRRFVNILKRGVPGVESIFLIAHNPVFEPLCDEKVQVVKEGGISRLEGIR